MAVGRLARTLRGARIHQLAGAAVNIVAPGAAYPAWDTVSWDSDGFFASNSPTIGAPAFIIPKGMTGLYRITAAVTVRSLINAGGYDVSGQHSDWMLSLWDEGDGGGGWAGWGRKGQGDLGPSWSPTALERIIMLETPPMECHEGDTIDAYVYFNHPTGATGILEGAFDDAGHFFAIEYLGPLPFPPSP